MATRPDVREAPDVQLRRGAKALITGANRILLVKERHQDGSVFWTLPGGGVEPDESETTALRRELFEELRCRAAVEGEITRFLYAHRSCENTVSICTVFNCTLVSPATPNDQEGIYEKRWLPFDQLPSSTLPQVRYVVDRGLT